ncbi:hypothetical protein TNCV_116141 [Trichonephila clavipes]|nr:hypothetical protein TNCV_116141 [Trichonephila clavipes]
MESVTTCHFTNDKNKRIYLPIEYATPFQAVHDAVSLLFGHNLDYYPAISLSDPSRGGLSSRRLTWELHRSPLILLDKGRSKVDLP